MLLYILPSWLSEQPIILILPMEKTENYRLKIEMLRVTLRLKTIFCKYQQCTWLYNLLL